MEIFQQRSILGFTNVCIYERLDLAVNHLNVLENGSLESVVVNHNVTQSEGVNLPDNCPQVMVLISPFLS